VVTFGPRSVESSRGSSTFNASAAAASSSRNSALMSSWTKSRDPAQQHSPVLKKIAVIVVSTACCRLASGNTTSGLLPPSSSVTSVILSAALFITLLPTAVDPVNANFRIWPCSDRGSPASGPNPVTMLTTPSGITSLVSSISLRIDSGVSSAGLRTTLGRQRRAKLPCSHQEWKVPWNYLADDTVGLLDCLAVAAVVGVDRPTIM